MPAGSETPSTVPSVLGIFVQGPAGLDADCSSTPSCPSHEMVAVLLLLLTMVRSPNEVSEEDDVPWLPNTSVGMVQLPVRVLRIQRLWLSLKPASSSQPLMLYL